MKKLFIFTALLFIIFQSRSQTYLPLTGGSGNPLTGDLYTSFSNSGSSVNNFIRNTANNGYSRLSLGNDVGSARGTIGLTGSALTEGMYVGTEGSTPLSFQTNGVSRYAIDNSGNHDFKNGTATFGSTLKIKNSDNVIINALTGTRFGYSSSYPGLRLGHSGLTLFFNVDVTGNPSGAFSGNGSEYVWQNTGSFITPNASNNGFNTLFTWGASGVPAFSSGITGTSATFSNIVWLKNLDNVGVAGLSGSRFGYSSSYDGLKIGTTGASTLFFNVDVSSNPSGAFNGSGSEYVWRNTGSFITPNSINNGYNTLMYWNSAGTPSFPNGLSGTSASFTGNVGIGTSTPDSKLTVAGKIHSQEVKVSINAGADFVFEKDYELLSLAETETYIRANRHLPNIDSADDMKINGLELGAMNIKLLQKIEELTLHLIRQDKLNEEQRNQLLQKDKQIVDLNTRMEKLEKKQ